MKDPRRSPGMILQARFGYKNWIDFGVFIQVDVYSVINGKFITPGLVASVELTNWLTEYHRLPNPADTQCLLCHFAQSDCFGEAKFVRL